MVSLSSSKDEHAIDRIVEIVTKSRHQKKNLFSGISPGRTKRIVRAVTTKTRKIRKRTRSNRQSRKNTNNKCQLSKNQADSSDESKIEGKEIWRETRQTPKRKCNNEKFLNYKDDSSSDNNSDTKRLKQEHSPSWTPRRRLILFAFI